MIDKSDCQKSVIFRNCELCIDYKDKKILEIPIINLLTLYIFVYNIRYR